MSNPQINYTDRQVLVWCVLYVSLGGLIGALLAFSFQYITHN